MNKLNECSIIELYSPPRVTDVAKKYGISNFGTFDITVNDPEDGMPWDLNLKSKLNRLRKIMKECKPSLLIGSPMCTAFSALQNMNTKSKDSPERKHRMMEAISYMKFACEMYEFQLSEVRYSYMSIRSAQHHGD